MDYVPAHGNTNMLADREDTSGARCFDGEDQGKWPYDAIHASYVPCLHPLLNAIFLFHNA